MQKECNRSAKWFIAAYCNGVLRPLKNRFFTLQFEVLGALSCPTTVMTLKRDTRREILRKREHKVKRFHIHPFCCCTFLLKSPCQHHHHVHTPLILYILPSNEWMNAFCTYTALLPFLLINKFYATIYITIHDTSFMMILLLLCEIFETQMKLQKFYTCWLNTYFQQQHTNKQKILLAIP